MDKKKVLIIIAVAFVLASIGYWSWIMLTEDKEVGTVATSTATSTATTTQQDLSYKVLYQEKKETTSTYEISLRYPQLVGDNPSLKKINDYLSSSINESAENFKRQVNENQDFNSNLPANMKSALYIESDEAILQGYANDITVTSIPLTVSEYFAGAAHPNNALISHSFNLETGEKVEIGDLFTRSDYESYLSQTTRNALKKYSLNGEPLNLDPAMIEGGTQPHEKNFSNFMLDDNQLIIIFNPYQVAPYAVGVLKVGVEI